MEGRDESLTEICNSPTDEEPSSNRFEAEPEAMDSMTTSPTSTLATTATDSDRTNTSKKGRMLNHRQPIAQSTDSSFSSSMQYGSQKSLQLQSPQLQHQRQPSGEFTHRRRQGTSSHRNSSFEYKETLDATTQHLEDGSRIINQYRLYKTIGRGAYGIVLEACLIHDPSIKFAVKEFGKTRLRKTHRAANLRRPLGRGGSRARAGFSARGARGGRESFGKGREDGEQGQQEDGETEAATKAMSKMNVKDEEGKDTSDKAEGSKQEEKDSEKKPDPLSLIRHEIAILKKLDHPNVVELYEVLDDPTKDGMYMVFEYCPDGRVIDVVLHEQVEPLDEETARDYLVQIMLGIEYLHHNDIVHRDIKPDNILLQDDRKVCKIVDFGVSEMFTKPGDDTLSKSAGSPAFMSPELCSAHHGDFHGKYSDVWSLGVTFYCMVVGRLPFDKSQFLELYEAIINEEPYYPSHLSKNCKHLLQRLMEKDPSKRITLAEMRQDPFITREGQAHIDSEKENTSAVVVEVTDEEVDGAIKKISSVFTLARAISKFKRAGSRASSTSSLGEATGHWIQKGKDMASMPEIEGSGGGEEEKERSISFEHLAAAHIAVGAETAKNFTKVVLDKGSSMIASPEQFGSQEEERKKGPPKVTLQSYFTKDDEKVDEDGASESGSVNKEKKTNEDGLLGKPPVSSPLSEDIPSPKGAAAAYAGLSAKEFEEEERAKKEEIEKEERAKKEEEGGKE